MDPNANLAEQDDILKWAPNHTEEITRLQELREALHGWLVNGGFDPDFMLHPTAWMRFMAWRSEYRGV